MAGLRFVIVGAGPAGSRAAEVLRQHAGEAEITLIGDEPELPYQRPPLSKAFITGAAGAAELVLKPASFFAEQRITLMLGSAVRAIDRAARAVVLEDGERVGYDKLLLATGCRARPLPPAWAAAPVLSLRSASDARAIKAALAAGVRMVLIGGGFIGLELAASARKLGAEVTVLEAAPRLMARAMPAVIGDFARTLHESHGVRFELDAAVERIDAAPGGGIAVRTRRADYPCDIIVAGIGAVPNAELAAAAGLVVEDGIRVDAWGRTSDADIFAAGDVTRHDNPLLGTAIRIESWQVALNHAGAVARAMLGGSVAYAELPWMWTDQYDCNIQVLGLFRPDLALVLRGEPAARNFSVLGLDATGALAAAVTVNTGRDMAVLRRLAAAKVPVPADALADPARKLADLLKAQARVA